MGLSLSTYGLRRDLDALRTELALNGLDDILRHSDPAFLNAAVWRDTFTDQTGVDVAGSTGQTYDAGASRYHNPSLITGNILTGGVASAYSTRAGYPVIQAFNGNSGDWWESAQNASPTSAGTLWLEYELAAGAEKDLRRVEIDWRSKAFSSAKVQYFDGAAWVDASTSAAGADYTTTAIDFTHAGGDRRRWRVLDTGGIASNLTAQVLEMRGYAYVAPPALSLVSTSIVFPDALTAARLVVLAVGSIAADVLDGAAWSPVTLEDLGAYRGTSVRVLAGSVPLAAASATSKWRLRAGSGNAVEAHAVWMMGR